MAAVLSPSHYGPAHGILINRSPSVSPYHHPSSLPPLVPSNPSLPSSSTSSASDLATDSDYYSSSSAATSSRPGRLPHDAHESKPRSGSAPNSRRIRFAPLPDPRRNIFLADDEHPDMPSVFLDDSDEQLPSQNFDASSSGKPAALSLKDQDAKLKSPPAGSLLFSPDEASISGSTPTLASTATVTPNSMAFPSSTPSQLGGEWVIPRSPHPTGVDLLDDIPRRSDSTKSKWSKKLLRPLLGPLASPKGRSTDDLGHLRTHGSTTSFASFSTMIPLSRQSTAGSTADSCYSGISSPKPLDKKSKKKSDKGGDSGREFGTPLYRWSSEGETSNKKGRARPRSRSANGTRLLNGRVYGAKRNANPFANVRCVHTCNLLFVVSDLLTTHHQIYRTRVC